jgi:hypothetical protein
MDVNKGRDVRGKRLFTDPVREFDPRQRAAVARVQIDRSPRRRLARDVLVAFVVKTALVVAAAMFLFAPSQRPSIDAGVVASRLIGPLNPNLGTSPP